jgi:hypothetical protein
VAHLILREQASQTNGLDCGLSPSAVSSAPVIIIPLMFAKYGLMSLLVPAINAEINSAVRARFSPDITGKKAKDSL